MRDVLDNGDVPQDEEFRREVVEGLSCPSCQDSLDMWSEVGTRFDFEIEHDSAIALAERRFGAKLAAFSDFLEEYPMLGATHPMGRRILREIRSFPRAKLKEPSWYRARRIKGGKTYTADDMRIPKRDDVHGPGRFNQAGQAHWYLASSDYTAVREVVEEGETMAWLLEWTVGPIDPILDLVMFGADDAFPVSDAKAKDLPLLAAAMIFGGHLSQSVDRKKAWKPGYLVPHFVADAARNAGFKGIRFSSVRGDDVNLVVFDEKAPIKPKGEPKIVNIEDRFKNVEF